MEGISPQVTKYLTMSLVIRWATCEKMSGSFFLDQFLLALNLDTM
jgi:hypothetical protein